MQPLDLISAAPWRRVVFTTYALSLSFFEAVVLERLVRGGGRNALILADPEGVRAGLSEQGARGVGRDYELEPVASRIGVFHPKLTLLFGDNDAHLLVGSGNLTFGGWGVNLETIDHLYPSFAPEAFDDAADMFEALAIAKNIQTGIASEFEPIAAQLRKSAKGAIRKGNFRLLHSMNIPIADQLVQLADELGGATGLTIVSPYFDKNGDAISRLSKLLNCEDVRLHAHSGDTIRGNPGTNWPDTANVTPVCVGIPFDDDRRLHAKCIEILCRRGRLLVSGSANATTAALFKKNIEASLVRIQRDIFVGWDTTPAIKPIIYPVADSEPEETAANKKGILRASLEAGRIAGQVIIPPMQGGARLSVATRNGNIDLGIVSIDSAGKFEVPAADLEMQSWSGGRMVLCIEQDDKIVEGFVSIAAAAKIIQMAGVMASRLFAMLSNTETPMDVAAILTWFRDDPNRLISALHGSGQHQAQSEKEPIWVSKEQLFAATVLDAYNNDFSNLGDPAWQRALRLIYSSFSLLRGPWKSETDDDERAKEDGELENENDRLKRLRNEDKAKSRAMNVFDELLKKMLDDRHKGKHTAAAFAIAHYLVDRIRPASSVANGWLRRILGEFSRQHLPLSDVPLLATAGILLYASDGQDRAAERARSFLLRANIDPASFNPDSAAIPGFIEVLKPLWDAEQFMKSVRSAQTTGEEVRSYLEAASHGYNPPFLPMLESSPHWPSLLTAFTDKELRSRFYELEVIQKDCPKCGMLLPTASYQELHFRGITQHCCRIILCKEI